MKRKEKMMKKLLIFMLVLGMASLANATIVGLHIDPTAPGGSVATQLGPSGTATVYLTVDTTGLPGTATNLSNIDVLISIDGGGATGTVVQALNLADLNPAGHTWGSYAMEVAPAVFMYTGGWQNALSANPVFGPGNQNVEVGAGQAGVSVYDTTYPPFVTNPPDFVTKFLPWYNGPIGYVEIYCLGAGDITVSIADGPTWGGSWMDDGVTKPAFGGPVMVYQVPEPMTVLLLGLGGLFLRRRK